MRVKAIYFGDFMGNIDDEALKIEEVLKNNNISLCIEPVDTPPFAEKYDILFFDWGGASLGNSMMESFCRKIVKESKEYPSRIFVMTSSMTKRAMKDAQDTIEYDMSNIFLDIKDAIEPIKDLIKEQQ